MSNYGPPNNHGDPYYGQQGQGYYPPHQDPSSLPQQQFYNPAVSIALRSMVALLFASVIVDCHFYLATTV